MRSRAIMPVIMAWLSTAEFRDGKKDIDHGHRCYRFQYSSTEKHTSIIEPPHQEDLNKYTYIPIAHTIKNKHSSYPHILPNVSPLDFARVLLTPSLLYKSLNITPQILGSFHSSEMASLVMRTHVHKVSSLFDPRDWCRRDFVGEV